MLRNHDTAVTEIRLESFVNLRAPTILSNNRARQYPLLRGGDVLPAGEVARPDLLAGAVVDRDLVLAGGRHWLLRMPDDILTLGETRIAWVSLFLRGEESHCMGQ